MNKSTIGVVLTFIMSVFMTDCNSDDDEIFGTGLTWRCSV
jgi:hypothetical protein